MASLQELNLFAVMHCIVILPRWRIGSVAVCAAWLRRSPSLGSRPKLAQSLCQVIATYALRLNSRAGTEGSSLL